MTVRVLSWNVFHGRASPPAGHDLFEQFAVALAGWEWDVALLQECPPWWPAPLAQRLDAHWRRVLTSRNFALPLRRAVAMRWPDLIKSNGGGCNALLVRDSLSVVAHRTKRLALVPERRWLHAVGLRCGMWVGNVHLTGGSPRAATREARAAASALLEWSTGAPAVLGGDFNLRALTLPGLRYVGGTSVDHLLAHDLDAAGPVDVLEHGELSDHAPIAVTFSLTPAALPAP